MDSPVTLARRHGVIKSGLVDEPPNSRIGLSKRASNNAQQVPPPNRVVGSFQAKDEMTKLEYCNYRGSRKCSGLLATASSSSERFRPEWRVCLSPRNRVPETQKRVQFWRLLPYDGAVKWVIYGAVAKVPQLIPAPTFGISGPISCSAPSILAPRLLTCIASGAATSS